MSRAPKPGVPARPFWELEPVSTDAIRSDHVTLPSVEDQLPSMGDLLTLPRLARVAYAARAARRVQPLFEKLWPSAPPREVEAVRTAVSFAEQIAEGKSVAVPGPDRSFPARAAGLAANAARRSGTTLLTLAGIRVSAYSAAEAAAHAAYAGVIFDAEFAFNATYHAALAAGDGATVIEAVYHDFDSLHQTGSRLRWTDETPVPVSILGPLWPQTEPDWWREANRTEPNPRPQPKPDLRPETRPDFLDRAKRILGGDIRPDDYLPVTQEVEAHVTRDLAFAGEHVQKQFEAGRIPAAFEIDPNARFDEFGLTVGAKQRNEWLLSLYYGGQNIACIENEHGVIVLAVGLKNSAKLLDAFPYEQRKDVQFDAPDRPDTFGW